MGLKHFFGAAVNSLSSMAIKSSSLKSLNRFLTRFPVIKEQFLSSVSFLGGFGFDIATLGRIDQLYPLFQQFVFILLIIGVFFLEARSNVLEPKMSPRLATMWKYREAMVQFLMGGLLSAFTLFYFKSASGVTVFVFVSILFFFLLFNERKGLHETKIPFRYIMLSLCLCSYFVYVVPIVVKKMNAWTFALSMLVSLGMYVMVVRWIYRKQNWSARSKLIKYVSGALVPVLFSGLYFFKFIPPVPMACLEMGVYHDISIKDRIYELHQTRPWWRFWEEGDQTFLARPLDKVYVFARIFAPTEFSHKVFVQWFKKNERSRTWEKTDTIPVQVQGGRDEGFRGYTYKSNYSSGDWKVLMVTEDGGELGYLNFRIVDDSSTEPRDVFIQRR
ncbi:MAG: DUF2914 domain-containing protein [Bdellovibrionota bacterium]